MISESPRLHSVLQAVADSASGTEFCRILNVGVGPCFESEWFLDLFPQASITLVDHDQDVITRLLSDHADRSQRVRIVHVDASQFLSNNFVMYDLVLVRHPNVDDDKEGWQAVFEAISVRLRAGGTLIATFYTLPELRFIERIIVAEGDRLAAEMVKVPDPVSLDGRDRYILKCFVHSE